MPSLFCLKPLGDHTLFKAVENTMFLLHMAGVCCSLATYGFSRMCKCKYPDVPGHVVVVVAVVVNVVNVVEWCVLYT